MVHMMPDCNSPCNIGITSLIIVSQLTTASYDNPIMDKCFCYSCKQLHFCDVRLVNGSSDSEGIVDVLPGSVDYCGWVWMELSQCSCAVSSTGIL